MEKKRTRRLINISVRPETLAKLKRVGKMGDTYDDVISGLLQGKGKRKVKEKGEKEKEI